MRVLCAVRVLLAVVAALAVCAVGWLGLIVAFGWWAPAVAFGALTATVAAHDFVVARRRRFVRRAWDERVAARELYPSVGRGVSGSVRDWDAA